MYIIAVMDRRSSISKQKEIINPLCNPVHGNRK